MEDRSTYIGGSDAAAVVGETRYLSTHELWRRKLGLSAEAEDKPATRRGKVLEPVALSEYARRHGDVTLRRWGPLVRHRSAKHVGAHIDAFAYPSGGSPRRFLVEAKTINEWGYKKGEWGEEYTDQIPREYLVQCHHYLTVFHWAPFIHLACLIYGQDPDGPNLDGWLRVYTVGRNAEFSRLLLRAYRDFWTKVEKRIPPPLDFDHDATEDELKQAHPDIDQSKVIASTDVQAAIDAWHKGKDEESAAKAKIKNAKNRLLAFMEDSRYLEDPRDGTRFERRINKNEVQSFHFVGLDYSDL